MKIKREKEEHYSDLLQESGMAFQGLGENFLHLSLLLISSAMNIVKKDKQQNIACIVFKTVGESTDKKSSVIVSSVFYSIVIFNSSS